MSIRGEGSNGCIDAVIVDVDGFKYFVVDKDKSKGDRRCNGKFTSNFFNVVDPPPTTASNNTCRQSHRNKTKRDLKIHLEGDTSRGVEKERTNTHTRHNGNEQEARAISITAQACTDEGDDLIASNIPEESVTIDESEDFDISLLDGGLRLPED
jgi:hypothetical protein